MPVPQMLTVPQVLIVGAVQNPYCHACYALDKATLRH